MRDAFVEVLIEEAKKNKNIELLTGDLGFGVLKSFYEQLPNQFTDVGIAEQNMTGIAAGMSLEGKIVFTYSIGNFPTLRCLEQIRNDCAYMEQNVKIVCVGGGFEYGSLGMSHQATEDIAVMRALPSVTVVCPGDVIEAREAVKAIINTKGTCYLRLGRGGGKNVHGETLNFQIGKAIPIFESKKTDKNVAVFSTGAILADTKDACDILVKKGIGVTEYSFPTVKPIDKEVIIKCAKENKVIATVEEHNLSGGFGSAVAEVLAESGESAKLIRIALPDEYCTKIGNQNYLKSQYGLDADSIAKRIEENL